MACDPTAPATKRDLEELATKQDLQVLDRATKQTLRALERATKQNLRALEKATKQDLQKLRQDMRELKQELLQHIAQSEERTMRHFDVVAEKLWSELGGALRDLHALVKGKFENHETRITRLEERTGILAA